MDLSVGTAVARCCLGDTVCLNVIRFFFVVGFFHSLLAEALVINDHCFVQKKNGPVCFCSSLFPFILKCFSDLEGNSNRHSTKQLFIYI